MTRRNFMLASTAACDLVPALAWASERGPAHSFLKQNPNGWVDISPGPNLEGWTEYPWFNNVGDDWRLANQWHMNSPSGILLCEGRRPLKQYHSMFLMNREVQDFILHVEWRFTDPGLTGYNSGVLVRMLPETPTHKVMYQIETGVTLGHAGWLRGGSLENGTLTVMDTRVWINNQWERVDPGFPIGWRPHVKIVETTSAPKGLKSAYEVGIQGPVYPPGDWNTYEVSGRKKKITVWVNGFESSFADNINTPKGRVGLESEGYRIEFRNIRLKELE